MTPFATLVDASRQVTATRSRTAKVRVLSEFLQSIPPVDVEVAVAYLIGQLRQGKVGAGYALLSAARDVAALSSASLTLHDVDAAFSALVVVRGAGSAAARAQILRDLFARAADPEREFLMRLVVGELRQGALEGVMVDAVSAATNLPSRDVRRAAMYAGDLPRVAGELFVHGVAGLARFQLQTLQPIEPMLAQTADNVAEAIDQLGEAALEWKFDGARIQVHKHDDQVRIFTRNLNDVTSSAPEIVEVIRALPARELVLDGEAIVLAADDVPKPFQVTMRRFGRKLDVPALRHELPLSAFFFDILRQDGDVLVDRPSRERFNIMRELLPPEIIVPRIVTRRHVEGQAFVDAALGRGHEGVMAKSLEAPYEAGSRGAAWLKIKSVRTLDLVVLAAEWGSGRRRGWLSNLHLGARDPITGGFVMLGKTFKGMTDAILTWQTAALLGREIGRDDWTVYVRPELVVEVAFNNVQISSQYPGGVTLRFARIKRYRSDKRPEEADTIDTVRALA